MEYSQQTDRNHILNVPEMYMGPTSIELIHTYLITGDKMEYTEVMYARGLLKIVDEILVNALDQWKIQKNVNIKVSFNKKTGEIAIYNTGAGFNVYLKKSITSHRYIYTPELLTTEPRSSSNFKDKSNTTGGINGYGSILTNVFSKSFIVETVNDNVYYRQIMGDNMHPDKIQKPIIIVRDSKKWNELCPKDVTQADYYNAPREWKFLKEFERKVHTTIRFLPDYERFGYKKMTLDILKTLFRIIKTRLYFAAVYMGKNNTVHLNKELIECRTMANLSNCIIPSGKFKVCTLKSESSSNDQKYPWEISVGLSDGTFSAVSIINGIVVPEGDHINYIKECVVSAMRPYVNKLTEEYNWSATTINAMIRSQLFILICGEIPKDQFKWHSQSKERLTIINKSTLKKYILSEDYLSSLWNIIKPGVVNSFIITQSKTSHKRSIRLSNRYKKAIFAKHKTKWNECSLFVVEGKSAFTTATRGIKTNKSNLCPEYYGILSLQGVPINVRKEVDVKCIKGKEYILHKRKLKENERFSEFVAATGLDFDRKYEYFPESEHRMCDGTLDRGHRPPHSKLGDCKSCTAALDAHRRTKIGDDEFKKLSYGRIIGLVDQDEDGKGQIWGLVLNAIALFWPHLFQRKWVLRFDTPVIRAYPVVGEARIFYTLEKFKEWFQHAKKKYVVKYYKGLASHSPAEVGMMFKKFETTLYMYCFDDDAKQMFEIYYGKRTDLRKRELLNNITPDKKLKPFSINNENITLKGHLIDCTTQLRTDVKSFQYDNIKRHSPHVMDGMVPARRKVVYESRIRFCTNNKVMKIFQLCGYVTANMEYHHGDTSLNGVITHMAQKYTGGRLFPLLNGDGEFGSRSNGGKDAGAARYIKVNLNKLLCCAIYPPEDDYLLTYAFEEDKRVEPLFYVPIIPMSILEDQHMIGAGWSTTIYAREVFTVIDIIKRMILSWPSMKEVYLPASYQGYTKPVIVKNNIEHSMGSYNQEGHRRINITELPRGVWHTSYIYGSDTERCSTCNDKPKACNKCELKRAKSQGIAKKKFVKDVKDESKENNVSILVTLKEDVDTITRKYVMQMITRQSDSKKMDRLGQTIKSNILKLPKDKSGELSKKQIELLTKFDKANKQASDLKIQISDIDRQDAMLYYFGLKRYMKPNLNFVVDGIGDVIIESYKTYYEILLKWFEVRKLYYEKRVTRQLILLRLRILMITHILYFIEHYNTYGLNTRGKTRISEKEQINIIESQGVYPKFNKTVLDNPKYTSNDNLENKIFHEKTNYNYLLTLNSLNMTDASVKKYKLQKSKYEDEIVMLKMDDPITGTVKFKGAKIWMTELIQLEKIIKKGFLDNWDWN